ncbi:CRM-domain containing factor CFM3A, chloroplastic/mitochondrial-like isoform X6 [Magnolia sinica]|uniref:CRM-domain containing factor CFM3A, chloroplastic/mitochondrial-like isoform X6 n=1 Tax=Magnolia sinica TaxID=86752 RepID=UPI002657F7A6|nr:CRM-domain containing factor CFM3A, chloroplastic/mitochondrial-like isoform X6 [Magnolia sinica]
MALSPPLSFNPFPSHFHYPPLSPSSSPSPTTLPILQIRKPFLTHFNPHKITFSSTALATQIQNEEHPETEITSDTKKKKKKKKKLRPGFYDQTQERWSVKIASNRTQFPWQEKPKSLESSPGFLLSSVPTDLSEVKADNPSLGIESSSFPPRNRVILAPWAHGAKQGKPHLNSEVRKRALVDETVEGHVDVEEAKSLNIHGEAEKALFGGKQIETHLESETEIQVATERIGDGAMEGEEAKSVQVCRDVEKSTVGIIVEKLKNLGTERNSDSDGKDRELPSCVEDPNNFGSDTNHNVCHYPGPFQDSEEEQRLYSYRNSATLTHLIDNSGSIRLPWERERGPDGERWRKSNTELAEKTIPEPELHRLRNVALRMKERMKVGAAGITQAVVDEIHDKWKEEEVVKIKFEGPPALNMKRTHEVLEILTGGTLVSRNKDYIVFYRGNDFLPPAMKGALVERQKLAKIRQDEEEQARLRASTLIASNAKTASGPFVAGTLAETLAANSRWGNQLSSDDRAKMMRNVALAKHAALVRYSERKLAHAQEKVKKAEKALRKVQEYLEPADLPTDLETITDEERFLFRKIGLSMKPFLLLGRRGVFDGTVENMHLHWKYRELVKIIVKGKSFQQVKHIAISLEAESGGVLISLDKTSKGYAIVVYRGKNYQRPQTLRPKNLLTRRQALARSIELQRREALNHHILDLRKRIEIMKSELEQMETIKDVGDEGLYSQLDDAYSSEDDVEQDEGEEAYLETYDSGDEAGDGDAEIGELANKREPI